MRFLPKVSLMRKPATVWICARIPGPRSILRRKSLIRAESSPYGPPRRSSLSTLDGSRSSKLVILPYDSVTGNPFTLYRFDGHHTLCKTDHTLLWSYNMAVAAVYGECQVDSLSCRPWNGSPPPLQHFLRI